MGVLGPIVIVLGVIAVCIAFYSWVVYLESANHAAVRLSLGCMTAAVMFIDWTLFSLGYMAFWAACICFVWNFWAFLDSALRFPAIDVESLFTVKLIVCVVTKTLVYCFGWKTIFESTGLFLLSLFVNVWCYPIFFTMSLPVEYIAVDSYEDSLMGPRNRDVVLKFTDACQNPHVRQARINIVFAIANHLAVGVTQKIPATKKIMMKIRPDLGRQIENRRSI